MTISTALSGVPELVIDPKTGFLVPPQDPAALADAVERVLGDYAFAKRLATSGSELVQREYEIGGVVRRLRARLVTRHGSLAALGAVSERAAAGAAGAPAAAAPTRATGSPAWRRSCSRLPCSATRSTRSSASR